MYFYRVTNKKTQIMSTSVKSFFLIPLLLFLFATTGFAQYQNLGKKGPKEQRPNPWFVGGMIGGSFSSGGGSFEISPMVGYKITEDFHVGSRVTYIYSKYNSTSYNDYGGSLFARHRFLKMLFAHVEYEVLSVDYSNYGGEKYRMTISSLFVGGGLYQSMGGRGFATIAILYNVLETEYSPYTNPVIRIGFGVGL